ncbi:MAG: RagB/SusD family nutrient uptake outer membrane protein [Chitinophagaceae bacterium]|nr:RagB/SusD family nutrient uptake outer membrane protein [Chitinophagaceae bacterium]
MRNNIFKQFYISTGTTAVILMLMLGSCKKSFLEPEVKNNILETDIWSSYQNANLFLNNIYTDLPINFLLFDVDPFDNWSDNQFPTFAWVTSRGSLTRRDYNTNNSPADGWWSTSYAVIRKCNLVIKNVETLPDVTEEQKKTMIGQAKFLRAYWYSTLLNFFGGVPLIELPLDRNSGEEIFYARSTSQETVAFIQNDLSAAADLLPAAWSGNDKGRATKGAALALKNEVELYAGKWQDCVNTANDLFALGLYTLAPDYGKMFVPAGESGPEVIFEVQYDGATKGHAAEVFLSPRTDPPTGIASGWGHVLPTQNLIDEYEFTDGTPGDDVSRASDPYVGRDERFYASVLYNGAPWRGDTVWTYYDPAVNYFSSFFDLNHSHQGTLTGYYFRKYLDETLTPAEANYYNKPINGTNAILFRLGEIYLNYAEAKNELGQFDADALDKLNELRARGGVPDIPAGLPQSEMRTRIRHERRIELAFEGKRYWDILRWKTAETVLNGTLKAMKITKKPGGGWNYERVNAYGGDRKFVAPRDYLFPIPQTAIDRNEKLSGQQNSGW